MRITRRMGLVLGMAALGLAAERGLSQNAGGAAPGRAGGDRTNISSYGYFIDEGWAKLPPGRKWGAVSGVDIDRDGRSVWVFDRCATADDCSASNLAPIMKFDATGKLVANFGAGMFVYPHGIYVDVDNNIWVTDGRAKNGKGQTVMKFSQDGKLLLTLGTPGVTGAGPDTFNGPSDVLLAPDRSIFVADGHGGDTNARIVKFDKSGKFIKAWGKKGAGPGEFDSPHGLDMDSAGRLYVADRTNSRIQIFDQDGKFLAEWKQFGRPSGIFITKNDLLYATDSQSNEQLNPGFLIGIRVGSVKDGQVTDFTPWPETNTIEAVAVDAEGNLFCGFTNTLSFRKFMKRKPQ